MSFARIYIFDSIEIQPLDFIIPPNRFNNKRVLHRLEGISQFVLNLRRKYQRLNPYYDYALKKNGKRLKNFWKSLA